MNSIQSILVVCLLAFAACNAKILSRQELQARETPPPCGKCSLTDVQLKGLTEALKDLGPALEAVTILIGKTIEAATTKLDDLKVGIPKILQSINDTIGPVLDKLYEVGKNVESCPALKDLFMNLKVNLIKLLSTLIIEWVPLIQAPDLSSVLAALSKALQIVVPLIFILLRDLFYNLLQVLGLCGAPLNLGSIIWKLLDPPNALSKTLQCLLQTLGGNFAQCLLNTLLRGLVAPLNMIEKPATGISLLNLRCTIYNLLNIPNPSCPSSNPTCLSPIDIGKTTSCELLG